MNLQFSHLSFIKLNFFHINLRKKIKSLTTIFQGTHNHQLAETSHLRCSFSKSTIKPGVTISAPSLTAASMSPETAAAAVLQSQIQMVQLQQTV